ncbi:hypothetical protein HFN47_35490 [Rhizobium leguminosarum]|nr:hypothetical protein [Rhizobium leguminosarum]MBY5863063.1 hypothetical protein [Rhizobium leguminosarum]
MTKAPARHRIGKALLVICLLLGVAGTARAADIPPEIRSLWPIFAAAIVSVAGVVAVHFATKRKVDVTYGPGETKINAASYRIGAITALFALFGAAIAFVAAFGASDGGNGSTLKVLGMNLLAAAAAGAAGAFAGFIFGIPRTLDSAAKAAVAGAASSTSTAEKTNAILASNTNLERISDWLTTLLVGATLVQIGPIVAALKSFADYLATEEGKLQGPIVLLLIYFFIIGFLCIYLLTRLYLTSALTQTLEVLDGAEGVSSLAALKAALLKFEQAPDAATPSYVSLWENWPLSDDEKTDPDLNYSVAMMLYRYLSSPSVQDAPKQVSRLRTAVAQAILQADLKEQLKSFFASETKRLGDQSVAGDISRSSFA